MRVFLRSCSLRAPSLSDSLEPRSIMRRVRICRGTEYLACFPCRRARGQRSHRGGSAIWLRVCFRSCPSACHRVDPSRPAVPAPYLHDNYSDGRVPPSGSSNCCRREPRTHHLLAFAPSDAARGWTGAIEREDVGVGVGRGADKGRVKKGPGFALAAEGQDFIIVIVAKGARPPVQDRRSLYVYLSISCCEPSLLHILA